MQTSTHAAALALSVTLVFESKKPPTHTPRRHLAQNVVCMFDDDRPPVINARRRGRLPRNVSRFWIPPLSVGQVVEISHGAEHPNNGKPVKLLQYFPADDGFNVEAVTGMIHVFDENLAPAGQDKAAFIRVRDLRRIPKVSRQRGAQ